MAARMRSAPDAPALASLGSSSVDLRCISIRLVGHCPVARVLYPLPHGPMPPPRGRATPCHASHCPATRVLCPPSRGPLLHHASAWERTLYVGWHSLLCLPLPSRVDILCPCIEEEERENDEQVSSVILYRNRFGGLNLYATVGVEEKIEPTKVGEHPNQK